MVPKNDILECTACVLGNQITLWAQHSVAYKRLLYTCLCSEVTCQCSLPSTLVCGIQCNTDFRISRLLLVYELSPVATRAATATRAGCVRSGPEVAGVTFSDCYSDPVSKLFNPSPAILQIWESGSCSDSGYNHRSNRKFTHLCTNPDLALASFGQDNQLPDRRVLGNFPRWQHRPSLIMPPRLKVPAHSDSVKRWNFRKAD